MKNNLFRGRLLESATLLWCFGLFADRILLPWLHLCLFCREQKVKGLCQIWYVMHEYSCTIIIISCYVTNILLLRMPSDNSSFPNEQSTNIRDINFSCDDQWKLSVYFLCIFFISPEVVTRSSHGLESDVWSLGCMLFIMLVGHPPFDTKGLKESIFTKVVMGEYKVSKLLLPQALPSCAPLIYIPLYSKYFFYFSETSFV